jgi:hypothetical protein
MSNYIASLDKQLAKVGEQIKLRRVVGTAPNQIFIDVECLAQVTFKAAEDLVGSVSMNEYVCILSPTEINKAQWPGAQPPTVTGDARIPSKTRGDLAFVRGAWRAVQTAAGQYPGAELVRIDMRVLG